MESIGLSTLKILPSVEMWLKSKGWGRGMILWHGFGNRTMNDEQGNKWWRV